jgi:hypothetical protein
MKKLITIIKLTETSKFKLQQALENSSSVLRAIKEFQLTGPAFQDMKTLEDSIQHLECFLLGK